MELSNKSNINPKEESINYKILILNKINFINN